MLYALRKIEPIVDAIVKVPPVCYGSLLTSALTATIFNVTCAQYQISTSAKNTSDVLANLSQTPTAEEQFNELSIYCNKQGELLIETATLYK